MRKKSNNRSKNKSKKKYHLTKQCRRNKVTTRITRNNKKFRKDRSKLINPLHNLTKMSLLL